MFVGFVLAPLGLIIGGAFSNVSFIEYILRVSAPVILGMSILYWVKAQGLLRPKNAKILSWEVMLFQLARWPWVFFSIIDALRCSITRTKQVWKITRKKISETNLTFAFSSPSSSLPLVSGL